MQGAGYGGNINRLERAGGWTSIVMDNVALPDGHPGQGQFVLATDAADAAALLQWQRPAEMMTFLRSRALANGTGRLVQAPSTPDPQRHGPRSPVGPSPAGQTWNGGLGIPFWLEPGEQRTVKVLLCWHFPHRYVNFEQFGSERPQWGRSSFWLGNHYATRFSDARAVREKVVADWDELRSATTAWTSMFAESSLDDRAAEQLAAQLSVIRSPTCFRPADGRFLGFEGTLGASTVMWSGEFGGSCPLRLRDGDRTDYQWGAGCLSDQLIGLWWAHQLGLEYLLPPEHVRPALAAVVKYNLRNGSAGFEHEFRVFADGDDSGLLMCSWPSGGRPSVPTRYADEVWTGSEYQVAAHCLWEGLDQQGWMLLDALWDRYDGRKRNPYNQIECGDHYVRAMAGWTVLDALGGFRHDVPDQRITLRLPAVDSAVPYLAATGWGLICRRGLVLEIECRAGDLQIAELVIHAVPGGTVRLVGGRGRVNRADSDGRLTVRPSRPLTVTAGERIRFALG